MTPRKEPMTGLERARRRRRHRSMAILLVVGILVVGGFAYAIAYVQGVAPGAPDAGPTCTPTPKVTPPQSRFTVNVYNSSSRKGAANAVADALRSHDFSIGAVGNDPYKRKVTDAGEIRFGRAGAAAARTYVAPKVPGARLVPDGRTGTSIDVAIGEAFPAITARPETDAPETSC